MSSRFKGKLCLHLRAKELTIFRDSFIWQLAAWAWAWAGVGVAGRWARRHAAPAVVGRFIFFSRLGLFWRFRTFGFWASRRRRRRNRAPPLKPPGSSNRKSPNFWRQIFFFKKNFGAKIFLAILKKSIRYVKSLFRSLDKVDVPNFAISLVPTLLKDYFVVYYTRLKD